MLMLSHITFFKRFLKHVINRHVRGEGGEVHFWCFQKFRATMNVMNPRFFVIPVLLLLNGALTGCGITTAVRLCDRQKISIASMVEEVKHTQIIFVGEIHDDPEHHEIQEQVIREVFGTGIPMAIGLEMFTAGSQPELDAWVEGRLDDKRFVSLYALNWTEPLYLYAAIFQYARANRIPMVGINVPREIIQEVKRNGLQALSEEMRSNLPADIRCNVTGDYLAFMQQVNSRHNRNRDDISHFCEAMMLWNILMARNIADYLHRHPGTAMVVLAGVGHARKKWGIPEQLDGMAERYAYRVILPELPDIAGLPKDTAAEADYLVEASQNPVHRLLFGF
jgi:uncharacterized iron-regulated protein